MIVHRFRPKYKKQKQIVAEKGPIRNNITLLAVFKLCLFKVTTNIITLVI